MSAEKSTPSLPTILVTNDDGIRAPALSVLVAALSEIAEIIVVAPQEQQSGVGKGLAYRTPLRVQNVNISNAREALSIEGTPASAVLFALRRSNAPKIDMVVSGINMGFNASIYNVFVSGTLGAAIEGALLGVPSVALSMEAASTDWFDLPDNHDQLTYQVSHATKLIKSLLENGFPENADVINVNYPRRMTANTPSFIVPLAQRAVLDEPTSRTDVYGSTYYWIGPGGYQSVTPGSDLDILLNHKGVAISPISLKLMNSTIIKDLKTRLASIFDIQEK